MTVTVPAKLLADAQASSSSLWPELVAIAMNESSDGRAGDYTVDGKTFYTAEEAPAGAQPTSFGYLQLHTPGGLGDGHSIVELEDPARNLAIGRDYLQGRLNNGTSIYDAMSPWMTQAADYALYQRIISEGVNGSASVPPTPVPIGAPVTVDAPIIPSLPPLPIVGQVTPRKAALGFLAFGVLFLLAEV